MRAGPAVSTTTRVPRNTASVMPWVTKMMVFFASSQIPQQLEVHLFARERVERAERLVHQDQLGIVHEGARDCSPLGLHAAGKLVWVLVLIATEPDQRQQVARAVTAFRHGSPRISAGSRTLSITRRHFSSSGC